MEKEKQFQETLTLEGRKKLLHTGVCEVLSQVDKCILAKTKTNMITVSGQNLRVSKLNLEEGILIIEGNIEGIKYGDLNSSKSFFKRIFK